MSTVITIEPGDTPVRDLPFGMVAHVCDVLNAYGLQVTDDSLGGFGIVEVRQALMNLIDVMPARLGGRIA